MKWLYTAQVAIPFVPALLGMGMLGLGADVITSTKRYFHDEVDAKKNHDAYSWFKTANDLTYEPQDMPYTRPSVIVAVGGICMLANIATAGILIKRLKSQAHMDGRKYVTSAPNAVILGIDAALAIFVLAAAIYSWLPIFDPITSHNIPKRFWQGLGDNGRYIFTWNKPVHFDPVNWFCALHAFLPDRDGPVRRCKQGNSLIDLLIPLLVFQAVVLAVHVWTFKRAKRAEKELAAKAADGNELPRL